MFTNKRLILRLKKTIKQPQSIQVSRIKLWQYQLFNMKLFLAIIFKMLQMVKVQLY
jgi:hypothetical protein